MIQIAIVDDHAEVIDMLSDWLLKILPGAQLSPFSSVEPALEAIASTSFDLVIADVDLGPGSSRFGGFRIAGALDTKQTPLLVISGAEDEDLQKGAFTALDAWDYMQKPITFTDFEREVRRAIQFRRGSVIKPPMLAAGTFPLVPDLTITRRSGAPMQWKGKTVRMPMSQIDIVEVLAQNAGVVVLHESLFECITSGRNKENLRVKISNIRDAFEAADPDFKLIETVPFKGYRWHLP